MVLVKAQQANAFLAAPPRDITSVLLFGTDAGLISERSARLARSMAERESPPGEIVRIDDSDLENDADRLALELLTVPMFGGRKTVRATAGRRITATALKSLIEGPGLPAFLIVEAGNLRPDDAMRALFEKSSQCAAIGCYLDEARDLEKLISEVMGAAGLAIAPAAREYLAARLGADRALSRAELEKLAIYAAGRPTIDVDDIDAVVGDAADFAIDGAVFAAAAGDAARAVSECDRAVAAGESPQALIAAAQRHFLRLHRVRNSMDGGRSLDETLRQMRPPLHFRQRDVFAAQCRNWPERRLELALQRIAKSAKTARLNPSLEAAIAERLLLGLATLARSRPAPVRG